jgi:hypothetical protein
MTIQELTRILTKHGITYTVLGGKVVAIDEYSINGEIFTELQDLTNISKERLYDWLGY